MKSLLPSNFETLPYHERLNWFKANSDDVASDRSVFVDLTPAQRDDLASEISERLVNLQADEEEYEGVKQSWNEKLKPQKQELKQKVKTLRSGQEEIVTDVYYLHDQDEGRVYGYSPDGREVESRRMTAKERQKTIHSLHRESNAS